MRPSAGSLGLSYQDSNLDKQNQNLMCYHYTIGQSKTGAKVLLFPHMAKFILYMVEKQGGSDENWRDYFTVPASLM